MVKVLELVTRDFYLDLNSQVTNAKSYGFYPSSFPSAYFNQNLTFDNFLELELFFANNEIDYLKEIIPIESEYIISFQQFFFILIQLKANFEPKLIIKRQKTYS